MGLGDFLFGKYRERQRKVAEWRAKEEAKGPYDIVVVALPHGMANGFLGETRSQGIHCPLYINVSAKGAHTGGMFVIGEEDVHVRVDNCRVLEQHVQRLLDEEDGQ